MNVFLEILIVAVVFGTGLYVIVLVNVLENKRLSQIQQRMEDETGHL